VSIVSISLILKVAFKLVSERLILRNLHIAKPLEPNPITRCLYPTPGTTSGACCQAKNERIWKRFAQTRHQQAKRFVDARNVKVIERAVIVAALMGSPAINVCDDQEETVNGLGKIYIPLPMGQFEIIKNDIAITLPQGCKSNADCAIPGWKVIPIRGLSIELLKRFFALPECKDELITLLDLNP
jgi:hypothetical protein